MVFSVLVGVLGFLRVVLAKPAGVLMVLGREEGGLLDGGAGVVIGGTVVVFFTDDGWERDVLGGRPVV